MVPGIEIGLIVAAVALVVAALMLVRDQSEEGRRR
jgi:hypothetical protein